MLLYSRTRPPNIRHTSPYRSLHGILWQYQRLFTSNTERIAEGDRVLLHERDKSPILTKPLRRNHETVGKWGRVSHESLIGKQARDVIKTSSGCEVRARLPSLDEYVTMTPRLVTPIYPADANLMVSLLDIHVTSSQTSTDNTNPIRILEAGTGHGALTLHLARAIHAANLQQRDEDVLPLVKNEVYTSSASNQTPPVPSCADADHDAIGVTSDTVSGSNDLLATTRAYPSSDQRRAIVETLDISLHYSEHAQKIVRGFRQGLYSRDVDFHVGCVSNWIELQTCHHGDEAEKAFLSHAILDLPSPHDHIGKVATALNPNGVLLVFNPSITQILVCIEMVKKQKLPLQLDRVLELGPAMTGGREWDIRILKTRAMAKAETEKSFAVTIDNNVANANLSECSDSAETLDKENAKASVTEDAELVTVCRPKTGIRVVGGGFLAMWRRMRRALE